jgi:hypothetical protein
VNYKRLRGRTVIWLTTMRCFVASKGKPEEELTSIEEKAFQEAHKNFQSHKSKSKNKNKYDGKGKLDGKHKPS